MKTLVRNLLILTAVLSVSANAFAYNFKVNGICYNILSSEAKTAEVTYEKKSGNTYKSDYSGNVVIPEDVIYNGVSYTVSSIGNNAFSNCSDLYSVTIGTGIRSINESAFNDCDLKKVIWLPNTPPTGYENVSSEKNYVANDSYNGLRNVTVYPYLSSMFEVGGLKYVPVSPSERTCEAIDCSYNNTAENIVIGKTVNYQGIEMTLLDVKDYACYDNDSIKTLQISDYTGNIGNHTFYDCDNLYSIEINGVGGSIGNFAFMNCDGLEIANIQNIDSNIGEDAFMNCVKLKSVKINNIGGSVENSAFNGCSNLETVDISVVISDIGENSFRNCINLKELKISEIKGSIKDAAFGNCFNLKKLKINHVEGDLGDMSFKGCVGLEILEISDIGGSIGDYSFRGCVNLLTLDIQEVDGDIGIMAFNGCLNLETVKISNLRGYIRDSAFSLCKNLKGIEIPNTVTGIGECCFLGCSSLKYVTIGSGISSLPESCFRGCSSLLEIVIQSTVESIGNNVFNGCMALARVEIADRQTELVLGYNSEYSNSDKKPLFSDCPLNSVYIGGNISYGADSGSGYSPFYRNTSLRAVKITDQETEISENEFYGCTGLTTVELGDGIESIGNYAFSGCSALESFTFGNSLATIGNEAFSDCTAMVRLVSKTEVPPVCGSQALDDINKWTCELFVPQKSLEAYKAAEQWKEFFFITGEEPGGIDIAAKDEISVISRNGYIEITGVENQEVNVYNLSGQLVYSGIETIINMPTKGIYIVHVSSQTFKVIL